MSNDKFVKDLVLPNWVKDPDKDVWIRSTTSNRGPVIAWGGVREGSTEYTDRRYSVVDATDGIKLKIIAICYTTPFKTSLDFPIHDKIESNESVEFVVEDFEGTISQALLWDGSFQMLKELV